MSHVGLEPLVQQLLRHGPLPAADCEALRALPHTVRTAEPSAYLVREGEPPRSCAVLLSGFAYRSKIVGDGGRAIVSIHVPGDAIDLQAVYLSRSDHNAQAMTEATLALVPMAELRRLVDERPAITRAVLAEMLVTASVLREWIANIARRDASTRLAHLLCEFATRMDARGLGGSSYTLPMTQEQIGDALGLTSVHVNRTLKALEREELITRDRRAIGIPDLARLRRAGDFNSLYLHEEKAALTRE